jgi:hypothetical protein
MPTLCRTAMVLLGMLLCTNPTLAQISPLPSDINTAVPGHPDIVYFDLLRQLVPDLVANETIGSGTQIGPIPHVMGTFMGQARMADTPDRITFGAFQTRIGQFEGKRRILVLTTLGAGEVRNAPTLLLAFSDEAKPKLLDAIDVAFSNSVSFGLDPVAISDDDQVVLITSGRPTGDTSDVLLFMRDGKFEPISLFARTEKPGCGFEWTQPIRVTAQSSATQGPYDDFMVTITDTGSIVDNGCDQAWGEAPFATAYSALFQWDANLERFTADMTELTDLKDIVWQRELQDQP